MTLTLHQRWPLTDGSKPEYSKNDIFMEPGTYTVQRTPNPYGYDADWLTVVDTPFGGTEISLRHSQKLGVLTITES